MSPVLTLTADAGVALGIAATAMPYTRTAEEQLERWLRVLGLPGEPLSAPATPIRIREVGPEAAERTDEVARRLAADRGVNRVGMGEVLLAVRELYGEAVEQALAARGMSFENALAAVG